MNWDNVMDTILRAHDDDTLKIAWDAVINGVEFEILNRYDLVDDEAAPYRGRAGPRDTKFAEAHWAPKREAGSLGPNALAWLAAARWAKHLMR
eukprot:9079931-Pyramimonas_sp.AAC.1